MPESKKEELNYGTVMAVGPGKTLSNGEVKECSVKEGDTVILPAFGGSKVVLGDEQEYYLYRDDDIMGTLHEPTKWMIEYFEFSYLIHFIFIS